MAVIDATLPRTVSRPRIDKTKGAMGWLTTVDHKRIAIMYLYTTVFFFLVGGVLALLIRVQLAEPDNSFFSSNPLTNAEIYNEVFTMHGTTMIFLWIIPVWAGFGNYFVPLMIGARDMAFPRINALSFWLIPAGGLVMYSGFLFGGTGDAGWTGYVPLTEKLYSPQVGQDLWILGLHLLGTSSMLGGLNFLVHHLQHASTRHDLVSPAPVRLGDVGDLGAGGAGLAIPGGRAAHGAAGPAGRYLLLRALLRRQRPALPAALLVLLASRGLHHDPARIWPDQRGDTRLLAQAHLRIPGHGLLDGGDRRAGLPGLHPSHVRDRDPHRGPAGLQRHAR